MKALARIEADRITRGAQRAAGATDFCPQCYRAKPLSDFISPTGRFVSQCVECRRRYRNWPARSEAERAAARRPVVRTGDGYHVRLTRRSMNRKTGPIPVSMTDMASCPEACPHRDAGCYAGYGKAAWLWGLVPVEGYTWGRFCFAIADLPEGTLWRHNEAGDLPGVGDHLDAKALHALVVANEGRRGFTFTHKPLYRSSDQIAIRAANDGGFTINLSADSLRHADELADRKLGPVVVVLPSDAPEKLTTPAGRSVIVCPAETKGLTCIDCGLCAVSKRKVIVGFRAHGQARRRVSLRVVA